MTSWIEAYDLASHYAQLPKRPLFFWHGKEDEKIPFAQVADFVAEFQNEAITFQIAEERHLVKGATMTAVTEFFSEAYQKSLR